MMNRFAVAVACAAVLVVGALEVTAQTGFGPSGGTVAPSAAPAPARPASGAPASASPKKGGRRFQWLDVDHDGRLSREEAARSTYLSKHFDEVDINHDGYITPEEKRQAWKLRVDARSKAHAGAPPGAGPASGGTQPPAAQKSPAAAAPPTVSAAH